MGVGVGNGLRAGRKGQKQLEEELKEAAIYIYIYLAMWDLRSLTRDRTHAHCIDSSEC